MNNNYPKKIADTRIVKSFDSSILDENVTQLAERYPFAKVFFDDKEINFPASKQSIRNWVRSLDDFQLLELGMSRDELATDFIEFMNRMLEIKEGHSEDIESITIIGGHDKSSNPENLSLTVHTGEIICIVGPTGSGQK
jgi:ABC-type multidrug transport system fused ATPase/permease subunit